MPSRTDKPKAITLADLSTEDRKRLLEQAREEAKHNPRDVDGYDELTERERAFRVLGDARDHMRGCPVQTGTELGRVEGFDARKPPSPATGEPERILGVIRCCECGGSTLLDAPIDQAVDEALADLPEPAGVTAGGDGGDGTDDDENEL